MKIESIAISKKKGTRKTQVQETELIADHGLDGDAHAGPWHRQVSFLSSESIQNAGERHICTRPGWWKDKVWRSYHLHCSMICRREVNTMTNEQDISGEAIIAGNIEPFDVIRCYKGKCLKRPHDLIGEEPLVIRINGQP